MLGQLDQARLLAVIETQNEIAASALDLAAVMRLVAERARELTRANASAIEVPEGDQMVYRMATGTAAEHIGMRLRIDSSLSGRCVLEGQVLRCDDATDDARVDAEACIRIGALSMICVPLRHGGSIVGVLKVTAPEPRAFDARDEYVLGLLSGVIAAHMSHASDFELARRQSRQDGLTGLGNRRAFEEDLTAALRFAARKERTLALCLFDVDDFKAINDAHGHPAGDAVLVAIGDILRSGRAGDRAYRLGGDEFALIMPETTSHGAASTVARVVGRVCAAPVAGVTCSVSAGWAEQTNDRADDLYAAADAALYRTKEAARER